MVLVLAGAAFIGGLGRVASMAIVGMPQTPAIVATALEVVVRLFVAVLLSRRES